MKGKIFFAFVVLIMALAIVGYLGQSTFQELITSIRDESRPNYRLQIIKDIYADLIESENSVRSYTITKDAEDLSGYYRSVSALDEKMEYLQNVSEEAEHASEVGMIATMISEKLVALNAVIALQNDDKTRYVLDRVIRDIESLNNETSSLSPLYSETRRGAARLPERLEPVQPARVQSKSFGFFKQLFGSRKDRKGVENDAPTMSQPASDSTVAMSEVHDADLADSLSTASTNPPGAVQIRSDHLENIIIKMEAEDAAYEQRMAGEELRLIRQDQAIMDKIRSLINDIEDREIENTLARRERAEAITTDAQRATLIAVLATVILISLLVAVIFNDISRLRKKREMLREAKEHAERLARIKQDFLSNMSHEIRTPLNAIIGFAEQLSQSRLSETQRQTLHKIMHSSDHLLVLINDILDFTKLEKGKLGLECVGFLPAREIEDVIAMLKPGADQKGVGITKKIQNLGSIVFMGDPIRYKQILINLVGNAIKFTEKGSITIETILQAEGETATLLTKVTDTGLGIPPEKLEQIFEDFSQADNSISRNFGGTGLGLSIVKKLVDVQNGEISVDSHPGRGSTFSFTLTYAIGSQADFPRQAAMATPTRLGSLREKNVLLVDDQQYNLELLSMILQKHGATVETAGSGAEALSKMRKQAFHLVLMDIQMPGMSGIDTMKVIRSADGKCLVEECTIIAVTADASPEISTRLKAIGFHDVLMKPFRQEELFALLSRHLHHEVPAQEATAIGAEEGHKPSLYDLSGLYEHADGNAGFVEDMLGIFLQNTEESLQSMKLNIEKNDWNAVADCAHKMLPSCRHLAVTGMMNTLLEIETMGRQQKGADIADLHAAVRQEWNKVKPALENCLETIKTSNVSHA